MNNKIKKQAEEFIKNINSEDRIAIITDHDSDGFTSGALFFNYCISKNARVKQFTFSRGNSKIEDFQLEDFNKIITTDLAAKTILEILEKYHEKEILFMDHHPQDANLPKSIIEYRTMYRGYIPSARSAYELTGGKKWIALIGTIIDAGDLYPENREFIETTLKEIKMSLEEFKKEVAFPTADCIIYLNKEPEKAFSIIQKLDSIKNLDSIKKYSKPIEEEARKIFKDFEEKKENIEGVIYFYFEPKYSIKGKISGISLRKENFDKIFIFASPKGKENISFSARNSSKRMDMAELLKAGIGNLEGAYGGHFAASGAMIRKEDLGNFKKNLQEFLKNNPIK